MNKYLINLNSAQREAVTVTNRHLLILAGAGTGKTRVITHRIAYMIDQSITTPEHVLAVTFTNKSAMEMQNRISILNGDAIGVSVGTFHSIAARILRANAELVELNSVFSIIDRSEQIKLVKSVCDTLGISTKLYTASNIIDIIARCKEHPDCINTLDLNIETHRVVQRIYPCYQSKLMQANAVDFGDLLLYNLKIFQQHNDVINFYRNKFKYIFIDEYQDTNEVQYSWIRMLISPINNLCCVGDDDQSIYGWRGANINNILQFGQDFNDAKLIKLEQNYRSTNSILVAAANIISNNTKRYDKTLWSNADYDEPVKIVYCYNDKEEARFVSATIKTLRLENPSSTVAVLVRSSFQIHVLEEAFFRHAIKYQVIGGFRFYERMEVMDMMAYLRVIINENDDFALERIINVPKRAIGSVTLSIIQNYAQQQKCSLLAAIKQMLKYNLFTKNITLTLQHLVENFIQWQSLYKSGSSPAQVAQSIFYESGYYQMLKNDRQGNNRIENIEEMLRSMQDYAQIERFIEHASLFFDRAGNTDNDVSAVNLMTLHAAKGLEFDIVFLPGWEEGVLPHHKSIAEQDSDVLEEERRIAYVGITRAKKKLYISYVDQRRIFNEFIKLQPSRFLLDIPNNISIATTSMSSDNNRWISNRNKLCNNIVQCNNNFAPGVKVRHQVFGIGTVLRLNDSNIEVAFRAKGIKIIKQEFLTIHR